MLETTELQTPALEAAGSDCAAAEATATAHPAVAVHRGAARHLMWDIVWFDAGHAEQAMRMVDWLPGGEPERVARCKTHHFRLWENAPALHPDGSRAKGNLNCVTADRYGSVKLDPGALDKNRLVIAEYCEELQELEPGLVVANIKPATWARPEFIAEAESQRKAEAVTIAAIGEARAAKELERENARGQALRRYLITAARFVLPAGSVDPKTLSNQELQDVLLFSPPPANVPSLAAWLEQFAPESATAAASARYDPVTFLAHAQRMASLMK